MDNFYALIARMKNIGRWELMRSLTPENVQEHSHMVAVLAHALAVIRRDIFGRPCDPNGAAAIALFHDAGEILTGDLPTPIKYHSPELMTAYRQVEAAASERLLDMLPEAMRPAYAQLLAPEDPELKALVKGADKLAAYIKCIEERRAGNDEFRQAERKSLEALRGYGLPEVDYFLEHFIPSFELTLDELGTMDYQEPALPGTK
ncbi:MAG: 5'-deoxynucleotidase [Oscillospiraceae bacterium]|nr:5'-deoxynucleotidase [Oscillospiraceae bacterium]